MSHNHHDHQETKPAFKTTEFISYVVVSLGVLLTSLVIDDNGGDGDYFTADRAWLYVVVLTLGYLLSRGLAKLGSHHHENTNIHNRNPVGERLKRAGKILVGDDPDATTSEPMFKDDKSSRSDPPTEKL